MNFDKPGIVEDNYREVISSIEEIIEDSENKLKTIKKIMEKYQLVDKYEIVCQQFANIAKNNY